MTCPACKINMKCDYDERYQCPQCRGELFTPAATEGIEEAWFRSMQLYPVAMRDETKTTGYAMKHGFLRNRGAERETWDASLGFR